MSAWTSRARPGLERAALLIIAWLAAGCAGAPEPGYPVFIDSASLPDAFSAGLPGTRAKRLAVNADTRRSSRLLELPPDWRFTTGSQPDKSVEIYVLEGRITVGEFALDEGGYAFLPAPSSGIGLASGGGARLLYFVDDADPAAVIRTPLLADRDLLLWESDGDVAGFGLATKVLRQDPGSGARTWLLRVEPGAEIPWQASSASVEGVLLEGRYSHAECVEGETVTGVYTRGGYFLRPAGAVNGGPDAGAESPSVWYLRASSDPASETRASCSPQSSP